MFEAQCRLGVGREWSRRGSPPLRGSDSWIDFIAIDGAYDEPSNNYMPATRGDRDLHTLRRQQIHGALRTLESLGIDGDQALVEVPGKAKGGGRDYAAFLLMQEAGRGDAPTPALYTVPPARWHSTFTVPAEFFFQGWVQVLQPSEVATWMILQWLSQTFPNRHDESGVYLYANARLGNFRLRRDSYEDACNRLLDFGLIQYARADFATRASSEKPAGWDPKAEAQRFLMSFSQPTRPDVHEPDRYQVTDEGLGQDAAERCHKELILRQHTLRQRRRVC
ncbi:hypothetical protein ACOKM3_14250 [Streptomyces sp. BH106]|uniref:hypothetical protein n=1 Tax=Streptomyces sp. BH106 TaxID=3410409 RepID=UPI003CF8106C